MTLKCFLCKRELPYLVVRTSFHVVDGKPSYEHGTTYLCPYCGHPIASCEKIAIHRLTTGK